jgi:hypothetical protein
LKHRLKKKDAESKAGSLRRTAKPRKQQAIPADIDFPPNPVRDLPPNQSIRKHPDEVYGDTEIPHRRRRM